MNASEWYFLKVAWKILTDPQVRSGNVMRRAELIARGASKVETSEPKNDDTNGGFSLTYLINAGLLRRPGRGLYQITASGIKTGEGSYESSFIPMMITVYHQKQQNTKEKAALLAATPPTEEKPKAPAPIAFSGLSTADLAEMLDQAKLRLNAIQNELKKRLGFG